MKILIVIQDKYEDRIVTGLRNMKPILPDEMTDLEVFQYRIKRMMKLAVMRSEKKTAKDSITVPDDLVEPEVEVVSPL